jgi:heterodisulfide reductase subunit A-like polyferredoxin
MPRETSAEKPKKTEEIRVGILVCHRGTHIDSVINVDELTNGARGAKAYSIDLSSHFVSALVESSVDHWENNT